MKRCFDLLLVLAGAPVWLPFLAFLALLVRFRSGESDLLPPAAPRRTKSQEETEETEVVKP